ncbi:substrate-binding domain-containing protein [Rhodocytophaga aerolata]
MLGKAPLIRQFCRVSVLTSRSCFRYRSKPEVNLVLELAESYMSKDSSISLAVIGGGSGFGIAALLNGKTHLANSSRPLSQAE